MSGFSTLDSEGIVDLGAEKLGERNRMFQGIWRRKC